MKAMMARGLPFLIVAILAWADTADAQAIRLEFETTPLAVALQELVDQAGIDLVFAERLIRDKSASCQYFGDDLEEGLRCILRESNLSFDRLGPMQFVLVGPSGQEAQRRRSAIAGFVRDRRSGLSLPGAHVLMPDNGRGVITSSSGYFILPDLPVGTHRLVVSFVGFSPVDTLLATSRRPTVLQLSPSTVRSQSVLVESKELSAAGLNKPPGLVSIPVAALQRLPAALGGRDLFESLSWMPGIRRSGEASGGLIVRGSGPDQNLYLLDGVPVYHPWHAFSLISSFQTETYREIRLYRGAFPAEYGGRLSSVLDASLSDGRRTNPTAMGAVNALATRFVIESPIGPTSSFMLSGRRSYIDKLIGRRHPVSDDAGRRDTLRTGYYFYDWSGKVVLRPDRLSRFSVSLYSGADNLDLRLPFDLSLDFASWLRPADLFFEVDQAWSNRVVSLRYERLLSQSWYLTTLAYDTAYDAEESTFVQPSTTASVRSRYEVGLREQGLKADFDHYRSEAHQLRLGFQAASRRFNSQIDAQIAYAAGFEDQLDDESAQTAFEAAAYMQDIWSPDPLVTVVAGARLSYFGGGSYLRLDPRLSVQYAVWPTWLTLRASLTRNHQFLHRIRDRYSFLYDLVSARWLPSSSETVPARGDQFSVGAEIRPMAGVEIKLDAYQRIAQNLLFPIDFYQSKEQLSGPGIQVGTLLSQYQTGRERSSGLEASLSWERDAWYGLASYTWSSTESKGRNEESFRASRFDTPHALDLFVRRRWKRWTAGLSARLRTGYPTTEPTGRYTLVDPVTGSETSYLHRGVINNARLPAYLRVDADMAYAFNWLDASWRATLQVYNLTATRNVIDRSYAPTNDGLDIGELRGLPILPLFELQVRL